MQSIASQESDQVLIADVDRFQSATTDDGQNVTIRSDVEQRDTPVQKDDVSPERATRHRQPGHSKPSVTKKIVAGPASAVYLNENTTLHSNGSPLNQVGGITSLDEMVDGHQPEHTLSILSRIDHRNLVVRSLRDPNIDICPSFSTAVPLRPFFEITLMGGLPFKSLILRDPELEPYQRVRENTEKSRSNLTAQAVVGLEIDDWLEVKTGLGFTQVYEVFDYIDQTATRTITNIVTDTIFVNGIPTVRTDTNVVTEYGQRIKLSQNRYTFLDIPFLAAYRFTVGRHAFFVQGGASINLALGTRGDILASDEEIISIDRRDRSIHPVFKKRVGFDLIGGLGYEMMLSENNALRIVTSFRHALSDMTLDDNPLGQRYDHLQLGISWKHQF